MRKRGFLSLEEEGNRRSGDNPLRCIRNCKTDHPADSSASRRVKICLESTKVNASKSNERAASKRQEKPIVVSPKQAKKTVQPQKAIKKTAKNEAGLSDLEKRKH